MGLSLRAFPVMWSRRLCQAERIPYRLVLRTLAPPPELALLFPPPLLLLLLEALAPLTALRLLSEIMVRTQRKPM